MSLDAAEADTGEAGFRWALEGRITVIDNGATLSAQAKFVNLMEMEAFSVIAFDPASRLHDKTHLQELEEFQLVSHALLGDGQSATLQACLNPAMSGTLEPLGAAELPEAKRQGARVLTRLPIGTLKLDCIEELKSVDWLLLDDVNDSIAVLENGVETLRQTLLIHVRIPFMATHQRQAGLADICQWMTAHGFQCYRFNNIGYHSHLPTDGELEKHQASQIASVEAIFTPGEERLDSLTPDRLAKLAFLMDTLHGIHDFSHELLAKADPAIANRYLVSRGYATRYHDEEDTFTLTAEYSPAPW